MRARLTHTATPSAAAALALATLRPRVPRCLQAAVLLGTLSHHRVQLAPAWLEYLVVPAMVRRLSTSSQKELVQTGGEEAPGEALLAA